MRTLRTAYELVKRSVIAWTDDYASSMGAAISFYTLFSLAPLLIILIAILGAVFGEQAAQGRILDELSGLVGPSAAAAIEEVLENARRQGGSGWAAGIGFVTLLVGATSVLAELQSALDRIWASPATSEADGVWSFLRRRVLTFGLILGLVFLLLVSLTVSAGLNAIGSWAGGVVAEWKWLFALANHLVSLGVVTLLFAMIYKLLPRERIAWQDVWVGAMTTAVLFTIGKLLIGLYLGKSGLASTYGAAGSLIVLLLWVYYSAQAFLLGAEFTWVYAYSLGSRAGQAPPEPIVKPTGHRSLTPRPAT